MTRAPIPLKYWSPEQVSLPSDLMATFFVDKTGVVTTATTDGDSIFVQSAATKATTLLGLAGNDTIDLREGAATNASAIGIQIKAADGADSITVSGLAAFSAGNHSIYGGAGDDTISISGSTFASVKANEGADLVTLSGGTYSAIGLSQGADTLTIASATVTQVNLGDGHDSFSAVLTFGSAAKVNFGKGRDTVFLSVGGSSAQSINAGDGQDSIVIDGFQEASTLKGGGGADTITLSGDSSTGIFLAGNDGSDLITVSGLGGSFTIGGGTGNDTIIIDQNLESTTGKLIGGAGDDSIKIVDVSGSPAGGDTYALMSIEGGAGADSITFSAGSDVGSGEVLGTLIYSSFSESNLTTMDDFTLLGATLSGELAQVSMAIEYGVDLTSSTVGEVSAATVLGNANFSGGIASNIVTLSGDTYFVSSVTAVAGTVDTLTLQAGTNATVLFSTKGGNDYLFVQGGTAGTSDDSIISLGDLSGGGGLALSIASAATLTFSGQAA